MSAVEQSLQVIQGGNALVQFDREKIDTIKRTVAKGVTDAELEMFLHLCKTYQLDPFLKEIWCYKRQKKDQNGRYVDDPNAQAIIMTSRDGYLKAAQRDENFDGLKSFVVREGDTFEIDAQADAVVHKFGAKRGKILGAWAICHHKQRRPVICFVDFDEYNAKSTTWNNYPSAMIQKVAEAFALKRQFGINGLVTQEEMDASIDTPVPAPKENTLKKYPAVNKDEWLEAAQSLNQLAEQNGITGEELRGIGERFTGKRDPRGWSVAQIAEISEYIKNPTPQANDEVPASQQIVDLPDDEDLPF